MSSGPRLAKNKYGKHFVSFLPAVSKEAMKACALSRQPPFRERKLQHRRCAPLEQARLSEQQQSHLL